ncbi:ATP-dependent protease La [Denitrovibrio acetiphilus DSM 12809]|uniref:Lon protease n=1 Tax=Denitrovibrio acetiphilus (strain DSM 12809 / NBRC 114555 / N2460) TaxID=522772 RepID=D4H5W2_DENA2|nr:endopeptidase La [Denitrovibrio acetiphilus]ADD69553.1 ATP-dependent protease La [Denitrovibrio acetiphilus DSM 12809]
MDRIEQYTLIPLRDMVIFPYMISPVFVGRDKSVNAVDIAESSTKHIFFALQKDDELDEPEMDDLYSTGVVAKLLQVLKLPDGTVKLLVEGVDRARLLSVADEGDCLFANVSILEDEEVDAAEEPALYKMLAESFNTYAEVSKKINDNILQSIAEIDETDRLAYSIAANMPMRNEEHQAVLEMDDSTARVEKIIELVQTYIELTKMDSRIRQKVKNQMSKAQKEYYLGEQVKAINEELGKDDDFKADMDEIEEKINSSNLSDTVKERAEREYKKLKLMSPMSAEATVVRNYLDWLLSMPWGVFTDDDLELENAEKILNRDHFGLEKPKERILEFLAVKKIAENIKGPIICFTGPPGVGKTSLAKSIAEAMNRKFVRMSLGGMRDEAEIRGHRKTYIGSMPGKILQSLKKAGSSNPVFLLDEIDKLGADFRGDPSSALLEVLDPEQNNTFMDHYLELEYDLSKVFFITTANNVHNIPQPLLDRMEVIHVSGYTEREKLEIAKMFLVPKMIKEHNVQERVNIADTAILDIIRGYTKEAGVRNLEREIASVVRKCVKKLVQKPDQKSVRVNKATIEKFLGIPKFRQEDIPNVVEIGVATGLAWTPYGGDILQIEVAVSKGKGSMQITGKLGDVMQESVKTAFTVVKSHASKFKIPAARFSETDIHVHVPEGAVPKDGPSAGITLATAIMSALSGRQVKCDIAMTGEITLRGRVLAIGGIKEKVLAAHRAGVKEVILPKANDKDLTEIPADVRNIVRFHLVENIEEVFEIVII